MNKITLRVLLYVFVIFLSQSSYAQKTFTSQATGSFVTTGTSVWDDSPSTGGPIASDFTDGLNTFIIADGHTITVDGAATITISSLEVGQGASGILTIGDGTPATVNSLTINGSLVIQTSATFQVNNNDANTHALRVDGDIVNNGGTFDLDNGTGLVNTTFGSVSTSVLSGSNMIFNDLTINGGGAIILVASIDVNGNFVADQSGTDISTAVNHNFAGDFTLSNSATYTATSSIQIFDGSSAQTLAFAVGSADFNSITFDNSTKTVTGNIITNGTFEITDDAVWTQTGGNHRIQNFEVKNTAGILLNTADITFTGGTIRFGDGIATDGTITLGTAVNLIIEGTVYIQRDDILIIDGDMEILSTGQFVINGTDSAPVAGVSDSELQVTGVRTLTIRDGGDIYIRGYDNFPTGFTTYSLEKSSLVRYDANFDQLVMGENSANVTIDYGRLYLSQSDAVVQRTRQLFTGDDDLNVTGQFDLINGARFFVSHAATLTFGEDLRMDSGTTAGDPVFDAANAVVILDANTNQVMDGPVSGNYTMDELRITNTSTPTTAKTVYIDDNIAVGSVGSVFSILNPNGSSANLLIVDLDDFQIFGGNGTSQTFTLGANCAIYTSTNDAEGFAEDFGDLGFDVINIDAASILRFDRAGDQTIPNFNGGVIGNLQFSGSGNRFIPNLAFVGVNLTINGDVTRVGGTPVFRFGSIADAFKVDVSHTVAGNWNMSTASTGDDESNGGAVNPLITFNGTDQIISASDFVNVTFSGSGTKTFTGTLLIDGDLIINTGVTVNGVSEAIDIVGDWTENGTGTFTQTGNTTDFNGGATQTVTQTANSSFFRFNISNNTTVNINSTLQVGQDLNIENGSTINVEAQEIKIKRHLNVFASATLAYTTASTTTIHMNGDTEQNIRNYKAAQNFPTLQFSGVGNKEVIDNDLTIEGNITIAAESTFNGNSRQINFEGDTWTNNGNFNHNNSVNFVNNGGSVNVSTSTFHDIDVGSSDGSITTTVNLTGNITLNGEMNIFQNTTLDVSASNYAITVEEDWNNYGIFNPRQGKVTFNGGRTDFRTFHATNNSGTQADKAFYDLTVNIPSEFLLVQRNTEVLNDQLDVLNDLRVESGSVYMYENANAALLNIGGNFDMTGGAAIFNHDETKIVMNGTSGTHDINLGGDQVRDFEINAPGATYQLTGDFLMRDDADNEFTLTAGTFDLNGNFATINRGGFDMTGGTLIIDEGASLLLNDLALDPDFNKTGGTIQITGVDGSPATLSSVDAGGFTFTQTLGDFQAQYYTIANTTGDGIRIEGGTIDTGATGNDFSNGTFTSGVGSAYLTLANLAIGTISADAVIFNAGPTNNVAVGAPNPASGTIEFVIAGGTLAGAQDELDVPNGVATTGFVRWAEDAGLTWNGSVSSSWNLAGNWTNATADVDGIPDSDDIVYLEAGAPNNPVIVGGESFTVARLTIRNAGILTLQGTGELSVDGNFTAFTGTTVDMTDNASSKLNVAGAWANAGTFNEGSATVTFNGTSGTHSITQNGASDPFYNLTIAGDGATYTLGSAMTINNLFSLTDGTFDASSGFEIQITNDWSVDGGTFNPGQGKVRFNGTVGTQSISGGTMWDADFEGAAAKSIDGNISIADDILIDATSGLVSGNDKTIFVGGDWDLDVLNGFVPGTGTVIFNGTAAQNLELDDTQPLTFNNVIFQNGGAKNFFFNNTINGDMSIISENTFVDLEVGSTLTVAGGITQTGGNFRIFDSNFPTAASYSFTGGDVDFLQDVALTIPAGITFNNLEIRALTNVATTATLTGDIIVNGFINFSYGEVTFDVAGHTVSVERYIALTDNETLTWGGGTLVHTGVYWGMDPDFNTTTRAFENLTLGGSNRKRPQSDIAVNGNLIVQDGVELEQLAWTITNDGIGGDTFTMQQNAILDTRVLGVAFPTGFTNYALDPTSIVELRGSGNQTIFTNVGTLEYGTLRNYATGITTLDNNLTVQGDYDMNASPTLADGGFNMTLNGSFVDIQDYAPTVATTVTFARAGDQLIVNYDGAGNDLVFENVVFGGSGIKTFYPNAGDEVTDINGTVTIAVGVTATTSRGVDFSGTTWTNNGTFNLTVTSRPFVFTGGNTTVDPGTNNIAALTVSNTGGTTVTIQTNGLDIGTGNFIISANATIDFGSLTHNIASVNTTIDPLGVWVLENGGTGATIIYDRNSTQYIPIIDEAFGYITGIPSIATSTAGTKILTGNIVVDNVTIAASTNLDVSNGDDYQITVNGNWDNQGGNFYERDGTVVFNADNTDAKTILKNGRYFRELIFQGTQVRTYTLQSNAAVYGNSAGNGLTLASATLDLNGNALTLGNNDADDPDAELNIIGNNGTLEVDAGATLQFETSDDGSTGGGTANTEIGGNLDVQSGGRLSIVGSASDVATVTRSAGANRIDINIESGGEIDAEYYNIQYLTDEGLEIEDGATIDPDASGYNFSNGTFSNLATGNGVGDANPITGNRYLTIESDAALAIDNVTFNFTGTPTSGWQYNVTRSNAGGNNAITFTNTSGPLGRNGSVYEEDGDLTAPIHTMGQLRWDLPTDSQWLGVTSIDWTDATNWDNGVPSIGSNDVTAVIALGTPFNPSIDNISVNISGLIINDGILRVINGATLDLDGDFVLGDGTGGAFIMDNASTTTIQGSWTTSNNGLFDHGDGTVTFDAIAGSTVSITPGSQSFYNMTFANGAGAGAFNIVGTSIDINGNLTISNSANVIPSTSGYNYYIAGDITATGGDFETSVDGEIIMDGVAQTITDMTFDELTASGSGTKTTSGTTSVNDNFIIESGVTFQGGGSISFAGGVTINGVFDGVVSQTYTFSGVNWIAVANSYTGLGTVDFTRIAGTQFIRQSTAGDNPVMFNNLTFSGTAQMYLGRLIGGTQFDGNVDMTGNLTVNNTINTLRCNSYLIDNTSGTGTFTLASGEFIYLLGANNFPANFAAYELDDASYSRYWGTIDQTVRGGIEYGHLEFYNSTTNTLSGNIDVDGNLYMRNSTLDVSTSNYSINLAGRWNTNYGNDDGSFISRSGTVTFDGGSLQYLYIGETGTQAFNDILINKANDSRLELITSDLSVGGNVNVFNGVFDINNFTASIAGNMNASGTGLFNSNGNGLYLLNATSGTPTISGNGSSISGSIEIDASGRVYELVDDLTMLNNFTITAGTLDVNGQTLSVGNFEDVVNIHGTLNVSTTAKPGGTLALGNDVQLVVQPGGTISIVGTSSQFAKVTSTGITDYIFSVTGTLGNVGNISARYYIIEYMGTDGIYVNANTLINTTNNFSDGTFQNGFSGGKYLRIENTQDLSGADRIENVTFDDNPGGGSTNIYKTIAASGDIEVFNYTGSFSGEGFDEDPNDLITWLSPPTVTWTGAVSNDWFTVGNWDSGAIPLSTQNVIIPQTLNEPIITDNVAVAVANNMTIEINAVVKINTADVDAVDLQLSGDLTFEASSSLVSLGADDDIELAGSWLRLSNALFTAGTSEVTFNSIEGTETIDNANSFYDLIISVIGNTVLSTDLTIDNDFTITSGTFDLSTSDLIVKGDFSNSGTFDPQSQTVSLLPADAVTPKIFNPGTAEFYSLIIGELAGNDVEYDLSSDLVVNHDFDLILGTLDPNTNNLTFGDTDAIQDDINITGTIIVQANETMSLGDDAVLFVKSGGDVRFNGTDASNAAVMTRRTTGSYDFTVESGGTFEATFFKIEQVANDGIWLKAGSTLVGLSEGVFNGGSGDQYMNLSNAFGSDITAEGITFNAGPTYNIKRNQLAGNDIIFNDAAGSFSGPTFELDDLSATTGEIRWTFSAPLRVWTGTTSTQWDDNSNWEDQLGASPASFPTGANTVQIPDVSGASNRFPIVDNTSGDEVANSLSIAAGATVTINDNRALTVNEEITNAGTITISGTGSIISGSSWTNSGTFNPGSSTVTLNPSGDILVSGGLSFYNLILDGTGVGAGIVFSSSSILDINNDFTIADGVYEITDAAHTLNIGGDFIVDDTNGSFVDNVSTVIFDGAAQNIGSSSEVATITFNNLTLAGSGIKTVEDVLDINGDLSVGTGTTMALLNQSITFAGSSFDVDGSFDVSGGQSTFTFDGVQFQVITGNAGSMNFDNLIINNTALGNSDVQLNIDVNINDNTDFKTGIIQSSGSNSITFIDNSTVSFDGTEETAAFTFPGTDTDGNSFVSGPVIKIGDDNFIFPIGDGSRIGRLGITSLGGGALAADQYSAEYSFGTHANHGDALNGTIKRISSLENWDLSNLNAHGGEPLVTLFWDATSEVSQLPTLLVAHHNGASWDDMGNVATTGAAASGTITSASNFTTFSPITLATSTDGVDNPLPVELLDFKGKLVDKLIQLDWSTASELNNDYFSVEHSLDGKSYEEIGVVIGNGTSGNISNYQYLHNNPAPGINYYRLRQVDFDGVEEVFDAIIVDNTSVKTGLDMVVYPNPSTTNGKINIRIQSGDDHTPILVRLVDMAGNIYYNSIIEASLNIDEQILPSNNLSVGFYIITIQQGSNITHSKLRVK